MGRHYLDPADEADPYKLPTLVVEHDLDARDEDGEPCPGWFYAIGFPGCLNDTEPCGPFDTEQAAVADARRTFLDD